MTMQDLSNLVFQTLAPRDIRYVKPPNIKRLDGLARDVSRQMAAEFQVVPPVVLHHAVPRLMAGLWAVSREAYVADQAGRALREAVGAGVSEINQCPYCVDVHVAMLHGLGDEAAAQALDGGKLGGMNDEMKCAVEWAKATLTPFSPILKDQPFLAAQAPKIIGTALAFHYINRMVHLFLPASPLPIPSSLTWLKRRAGAVFGKTVGRTVATLEAGKGRFPLAGEAATLPAEFGWAKADARIAAAFALFAKVAEEAGSIHLDAPVMALVMDHIVRWQGEAPGMGRKWVEQAVRDLPEAQRPAARLALLTAFASYQVTAADIAAFRAQHPTDTALIGVTGWASYQAMRRISSWLHAPDSSPNFFI